MKKVIYLFDKNWNKIMFQYDKLSELKEEFKKRSITIGDDASIGNNASIGDDASIGYRASIGDDASIGYRASIGDDASIGCGASIGDGVELKKTLYVVGSKHIVTYTGNDTVSIGCYNYKIDKWLEKFEVVGQKEGYSVEEINEYKQYILMAQTFSKL